MKQFFIIGRPRSGNTLLRVMLDSHPNCVVPSEYPILHRILPIRKKKQFKSARQKKKLINQYFFLNKHFYPFYDFLKLDQQCFIDEIIQEDKPLILCQVHGIFQKNCFSLIKKEPILAVGDMNPVYCFFVETLFKHFPDAYFIFLIRNPFDQVALMKKIPTELYNANLLAIRWKYVVKKMIHFNKKYPYRTLIIRYENIVNYPEQVLNQIYSFLSIDNSTKTKDFETLIKNVNLKEQHAKFIEYYHSSLFQPITNKKIHLYKNYLSQKQIDIIAYHCEKIATSIQYEIPAYSTSLLTYLNGIIWKIYFYFMLLIMKSLLLTPVGIRHKIYFIIEKIPFILRARKMSKVIN